MGVGFLGCSVKMNSAVHELDCIACYSKARAVYQLSNNLLKTFKHTVFQTMM